MHSPHDAKKSLRSELLSARKNLPAEFRAAADATICEGLKKIIPAGASVAGYLSHQGEVDIAALMNALSGNHILSLPAITPPEKILNFLEWKPGDKLIEGAHNIPHPEHSAREIMPDIIIIPLLAFDATGARLGYGGGYYDATIRALRMQHKTIKFIGAAYSLQQVATLPREAHDEILDAVVTEQGAVHIT